MKSLSVLALVLGASSILAACGGTATSTSSSPSTVASVIPAPPTTTSGRREVTLVAGPRARLVETASDLQKGDVAGARAAFEAYDGEWNGIEVYVNYRSRALYGEIETHYQTDIAKALTDPKPDPAAIIPQIQSMVAQYDQAIKLSDTGPAISPLFDDVATVRIVRAPLRTVSPALTAGDLGKAKTAFAAFKSRWNESQALFNARSADAAQETDAALAQADKAMSSAALNPAVAAPLVDALMDRYNYGVNLLNAAARNADIGKTTFTDQDVKTAAALGAVQQDLKGSLALWTNGNYKGASDGAQLASQRFAPL